MSDTINFQSHLLPDAVTHAGSTSGEGGISIMSQRPKKQAPKFRRHLGKKYLTIENGLKRFAKLKKDLGFWEGRRNG